MAFCKQKLKTLHLSVRHPSRVWMNSATPTATHKENKSKSRRTFAASPGTGSLSIHHKPIFCHDVGVGRYGKYGIIVWRRQAPEEW